MMVDLGAQQHVSIVRLREAIALGQRVRAFGLDAWQDGAWMQIAGGTSVGACRLIRLENPTLTSRLRLRIVESDASIALAELSVFGTVAG